VVVCVTEREAAMAVALSRGVGPAAAARLRAEHGSYLEVVRACFRQTRLGTETSAGGAHALPADVAGAVRSSVQSREYEAELELTARAGARFGLPGEGDYPDALSEIAQPPVGIYVAGDELSLLVPMVGVVGTRTPTPRGAAVATELAADLAREGVTVVSGMARGVDSRAHGGAIEAGGRTVAVMGCGLSHTYPPENDGLRAEIERHGSLVSEFPMRAEPLPGRFPRRNRIIAGLSAGVVVVEAAARSGALITAARALEQGREVFAVPGPVDGPLSAGPNRLIKAGAKLVEDAGDVLDELERSWGPFPVERRTWGPALERETGPNAGPAVAPGAGPEAALPRAIACELSLTPLSVDELVGRTRAPVQDVLAALLKLELEGRAERTPGGRYVRGARVAGGRR
jgi:DNA processing protein